MGIVNPNSPLVWDELMVDALTAWMDAHPAAVILLLAWSLIWKGLALWKSAELRQKYWFVILIVVNTFGLLEILYLIFVARRYKVEVVEA